jgi:glucosamine-6-phosphate deaminase
MRVAICASIQAATALAALRVGAVLRAQPRAVLALATGRTPVRLYRTLVRLHRAGELNLSQAAFFNLDEFAGVPPDRRGSFATFLRRHLTTPAGADPAQVHFLDGAAKSWRDEARRYEEALARAGGLDLAILGIGRNGHIAFNEPAARLGARTHLVRLTPATRRVYSGFAHALDSVPTHAITMGMATIMEARELLVLASGRAKAAIVARALQGPITTHVPASLLQLHPNVTVVLDRLAASLTRTAN